MAALLLHSALILCFLSNLMHAQVAEWKSATATYSTDSNDSMLTEGACGYGDLHKSYGKYTTGLSGMLFDRGSSCGACFEVRSAQLPQATPPILVTATDFCPPNYALPADHGGWCNFPRAHFHLPEATFSLISHLKPQLLPIHYRRATCQRQGGIHFTVKGSAIFMQVLVSNVGLDGQVVAVKVKGSRTGWIPMGRDWGQNWQTNIDLVGQPLSFEVTTAAWRTLTSYSVAPPNWMFGQTFTGKQFQHS
ncbi:expansin-A16-like [Salvia splendens]|uniref:expansin-A16-like n=1 Tax=Salvia splendens TaxID=180675 RepID=UPI001C27C57E|nr:expansin-A16-like [Salvia splendens]